MMYGGWIELVRDPLSSMIKLTDMGMKIESVEIATEGRLSRVHVEMPKDVYDKFVDERQESEFGWFLCPLEEVPIRGLPGGVVAVDEFVEEGLAYEEVCKQEYSINGCKFSAGFVAGENKPDVDTMYLRMEKDGEEPTIILLRPDELQALAWVAGGAVWSHLMHERDVQEELLK